MPIDTKPTRWENLFPNIKTKEGLKKARIAGVLAAAYLGIAFIVTSITTGTTFDLIDLPQDDNQFIIILSAIGAIGWFFAAYRIYKGKGRIAIWLVLTYAIYSLVTKLAFGGGFGPGPFFSLLAIWASINGIRATLTTENTWPFRLLLAFGVISLLWSGLSTAE